MTTGVLLSAALFANAALLTWFAEQDKPRGG